METVYIIVLALALDLVLGEYPAPLHPVVWLGKFISLLDRFSPSRNPKIQFTYGAFLSILTVSVAFTAVFFILGYLKEFNTALYVLAGGLILKPAFCLREQWVIALKIKKLLEKNRSGAPPKELETLLGTVPHAEDGLSREDVISASIRSISENASDFFVAPLFYFIFLGVPGAFAYRAINTLDSMIGYHGKYEYLGKFAARLDDVANFVPARLTALLFVIGAFILHQNYKQALRSAISDHANTTSPNAGWPMAAMAGALDVSLEKSRCYTMGKSLRPLSTLCLTGAARLYKTGMFIWAGICIAIVWM
ncbi:MAG: cobalamin biosynthesis protein CobD [Dehalococcoides mccartyi]|uniref:adenosylcobinamide-phosphate synthase CbiB n=1 Tax=Dehalococcoides mccartyi TaxID=61435 RepID=UPI000804F182|nr:adenosylcobinamide-phosphate synthase CbiB [Dehalococcoides mccartyi]OBW61150.1 MAG: cobalamin biosynthesis protein CobD [Dehalococcoides mccartyi]